MKTRYILLIFIIFSCDNVNTNKIENSNNQISETVKKQDAETNRLKEVSGFPVITIDGKLVNYSINHPFKKIPIELIFLYDKKSGHFKSKEDYSKKYISIK